MKLAWSILVLMALLAGAACMTKRDGHAVIGRWILVAGGANEHVILDLKPDQSYALRHWVDFHDIRGEDRGAWSLKDGIIALAPTVRGAVQGEVFIPHHCAKLQIATYEQDLALVSVSVPIVPYSVRQHAIFLKEKPKARQPTPGSVTPRASEGVSK